MRFAGHPRRLNVVCLLVTLNSGFGGAVRGSVVTDNPAAWNLTFNDDFSGSSLDGSKWANRYPGQRNSAVNTGDAVSVGGGLLTITTYTEGGTNYTGMIGSQGKFQQTYGYFEARMKFHSTAGQWSAFWLQSPTYGNPIGNPAQAGTEIDVVEHRAVNGVSGGANGSDIRNRYVSALHWDGYAAAHQSVGSLHAPQPGLGNDTWHTYGLKWSPSGYEYYFDDALLWTVTQAVSERSEYMILSSEVNNGGFGGFVPAGGYGSFASSVTNMQVDYVRVYEAVTPPPLPGDFNEDGHVNGLDLANWRANFGRQALSGHTQGDADGDRDVDGADYLVWQQQVGLNSSVPSTIALAAVPEPSAPLLATIAAATLALAGRSNRQHVRRHRSEFSSNWHQAVL